MRTLTDIQKGSTETRTLAMVKSQNVVVFKGEVSISRLPDGGYVINNEAALKAAYPGAEFVELNPLKPMEVGYIWSGGTWVAPDTVPRFAPYQITAMFSDAERARYFAAIDAKDVGVRTVQEMIQLQAGTLIEGTHPVVQSALVILRAAGVIDTDERLTALGNAFQGIA